LLFWICDSHDDSGRLVLLYTAHSHRDGQAYEAQCVARAADERADRFVKEAANPVLASGRYPPGDFRDPKIWRHGDAYYMVLGTRVAGTDGPCGAAAIFTSRDLISWTDVGILCQTDGTMCECPDFFPLGDAHVLIYSPIGRKPRRAMAVMGSFDYSTHRFQKIAEHELDLGPDFYAPQTALDGAGRRLVIGWLGSWDVQTPPSMRREGFAWQMTLPRVLTLRDGRVASALIEPALLEPLGDDRSGASLVRFVACFNPRPREAGDAVICSAPTAVVRFQSTPA
jgi:beta-fructofuranosidase